MFKGRIETRPIGLDEIDIGAYIGPIPLVEASKEYRLTSVGWDLIKLKCRTVVVHKFTHAMNEYITGEALLRTKFRFLPEKTISEPDFYWGS